MQRNLSHIWGDMMHYRLLHIRHLGGRVPPAPAGFTPLREPCYIDAFDLYFVLGKL